MPFQELPPRARRIPAFSPSVAVAIGTTSACAENTQGLTHDIAEERNYLRVRGEYLARSPATNFLSGTTSACAENTPAPMSLLITSGNYLRVRGEYCFSAPGCFFAPELPPRARRIQPPDPCAVPIIGTTSACAENTLCLGLQILDRGNYLRVRGEYGIANALAGMGVPFIFVCVLGMRKLAVSRGEHGLLGMLVLSVGGG